MKLSFKHKIISNLLLDRPLVAVDVGARGGIKASWEQLRPHLRCIAFEPNLDEYKRLLQLAGSHSDVRYLNMALWDEKKEIALHLTKIEGLASIYPPNRNFLESFDASNVSGYKLQGRNVAMRADRLDNLLSPDEQKTIDYIKVDVEGAAYQVLSGAEKTFRDGLVLGMQIEAEFNQKYQKQHLFSDVDRVVRPFGYQLFDIETCHWKRKAGLKTGGTAGQPVHGELTYFLSPDIFFQKIESFGNAEKAAKTIKFLMLLAMHGVYDLAFEVLVTSEQKECLDPEVANFLHRQLSKTITLLSRVPKLKERGIISRLLYHAFMLSFGVWLEYFNFWAPQVEA